LTCKVATCSQQILTLFCFIAPQPKPILYFEPSQAYLFDVQWSPSRPLVFAAADAEGKVHIFDLKENMTAPVIVLQASDKHAVTSIAFSASDS